MTGRLLCVEVVEEFGCVPSAQSHKVLPFCVGAAEEGAINDLFWLIALLCKRIRKEIGFALGL